MYSRAGATRRYRSACSARLDGKVLARNGAMIVSVPDTTWSV